MNKTKQIIPQINKQLEQFKSSIDVIIQQNNEYFNSIKRYSNKTFDIEINGELTEEKKNEIDTMIDQLEDIQQRNEIVLQNLDEFNLKMKEMKETMENTLENEYLENQEFCQNKLDELSEIIIDYCDDEKEKELTKLEEEKRKIMEKYDQISNPYNKYVDQMIHPSIKDSLDFREMKKLEKWTNKKCGEVIFDSDKDNWSRNTSVFDDRVMNKSYLTFIVEETSGNKFGYYFNGTVNKYNSCIKSTGCFQFSLKSNGRINGMMKFEQQGSCGGLCIDDKRSSYLFQMNGGICPHKENSKGNSYLYENTYCFDFHGYKNVFLSNSFNNNSSVKFTPKRITVIQMK